MKRMITPEMIDQIVRTIAARFDPERIILFGSWARGDARADSDLDLLVEMDTEVPRREQIRRIHAAFDPYPWAMDIVVYTPARTERWRHVKPSLPATVVREGKVLYERR